MKTRILILSVLFSVIGMSCKPRTTEPTSRPETAIQPNDFKKMILAKVYIKPGSESDFINVAQTMIENSNKEEGCLGYMLYQDPYEKTNFIFVESYRNQAAVDAHFVTSYFKDFGGKIADLTSKPSEIKILDIAGEKEE
jgi:quinol monooxygenase YgiN